MSGHGQRMVFVLGTMFQVDSRIAGDILGITPEAYRQRLSRIRRLNPAELDYTAASKTLVDMGKAMGFKNAMEEIDDLSTYFSFRRLYESPEQIKRFLTEFLESTTLSTVKNA